MQLVALHTPPSADSSDRYSISFFFFFSNYSKWTHPEVLQKLSSALSSACDFKSHFLQTMWTQIRLLLQEQSDQGPHCLPVYKSRFEKFASIFSRRHKLTTFSYAGFLGILRLKHVQKGTVFWRKGSLIPCVYSGYITHSKISLDSHSKLGLTESSSWYINKRAPSADSSDRNILIKVQNDYNKVFCWFSPVT